MKKTCKFNEGFSELENKELKDLKTITGGLGRTTKCQVPTSGKDGSSDTEYWVDDKHVATMTVGPLE